MKPYPKVNNDNDELCLVCDKLLGNDYSVISNSGWANIKSHAKEWSEIPIDPGEEYYGFTLVHGKVDGV